MSKREPADEQFEQAALQKRAGLLAELWAFMRENKKWWLTPILLSILLLGALIFLSGSGAGPFLYTLF